MTSQQDTHGRDASYVEEIADGIVRLASLFQQSYRHELSALGLDAGAYGVLAALRQVGAPFELTPSELARQRMMTSGGMTAAVDRLERQGLVARLPNPADRRGSLVRLTESGRDLAAEAMEVHSGIGEDLVSALDDDEREYLAELLEKIVASIDAG